MAQMAVRGLMLLRVLSHIEVYFANLIYIESNIIILGHSGQPM